MRHHTSGIVPLPHLFVPVSVEITSRGRRIIAQQVRESVEACPQCGGPMERVRIAGHDSWECPVDAYAYAVDQDALDWNE